jgi:hypothetical protein
MYIFRKVLDLNLLLRPQDAFRTHQPLQTMLFVRSDYLNMLTFVVSQIASNVWNISSAMRYWTHLAQISNLIFQLPLIGLTATSIPANNDACHVICLVFNTLSYSELRFHKQKFLLGSLSFLIFFLHVLCRQLLLAARGIKLIHWQIMKVYHGCIDCACDSGLKPGLKCHEETTESFSLG